jgi:hypothetical protein
VTLWARPGDVLDVVVVQFEPTGSPVIAYGGRCFLLGYTATESSGANPATIKLVDGISTNGKSLDRINLVASETARWNPGMPGMPCNHGLFINPIAGAAYLYLTIGRWVKENDKGS